MRVERKRVTRSQRNGKGITKIIVDGLLVEDL